MSKSGKPMNGSQLLPPRSQSCHGFTLLELLVVVAIIALLVGILLPSLSGARKQARAAACMSNLRQFGMAMRYYQQANRDYLPGEGLSDGDLPANPLGPWDDRSFWANVLPPMISSSNPTYYQMQNAHLNGGKRLPNSRDNDLFVCPQAGPAVAGQTPAEVKDGYFMMWGLQPGAKSLSAPREQRPTYWCYVFNSGLDNLLSGSVDIFGTRHLRVDSIRRVSDVPVLVEKMMDPDESQPRFNNRLNRSKTKGNAWNSCRLSGRHQKGGYLAFLDGHVGWISREVATTDSLGDGSYRSTGSVLWQPK